VGQNEDTSVVVIGGGISGLSVAWFLRRKGIPVRVLESGSRVGGVIGTERDQGYLIEQGPNSTLQKPGRDDDALGRLISQVALNERLVEAGDAGKKRFVLRGGRLQALPSSPPAFLMTGLFSPLAKLRLLLEPFIGRAEDEETIARFVERRLGREFLDYAVEPFVSGVYAGDPARLSVQAAVPRIYELERTHGSLIRGAIALGKAAKGAGMPAGRLISFDDGMALLPDTIAERMPPDTTRTGCRVVGLRPLDKAWQIDWQSAEGLGSDQASRVILAIPAPEAADLLDPLSGEAARLLRSISYAPIVSAALSYERDKIAHPLDGFGFLAPRKEGMRTLGGLFSSTLFAHRAPAGKVLVTSFMGGMTDPQAVRLNDESTAGQIHADLEPVLGIGAEPCLARITRYSRSIPQYTLGHLEKLSDIDQSLAALPGLYTQASWRGGISVADCIRNGEALAGVVAGDILG
jgi:protoporphyrinogen/coproporphyrinogen III oxidase